jgi:ABC-type multidrug transport system ATPase subunit
MSEAISAAGLGVVLGDQPLLRPVSFTLAAGRTLAVVGANGSGKTTLLQVLAGRRQASTGTVAVDGERPDERRPTFRARVAALLGVPPLARNLTLREYLVLVAVSWGASLEAGERRADELLDELGIAGLSARFPHELSSGQTQLYLVAVVLARPFEIVLLDEPEQRLDPDRVLVLGDALARRAHRGATIVLASHSRTLVDRLADQVLTLVEDGDDLGS